MNSDKDVIVSENAPVAVGAYPHARRVGDFVFLSGVGPRQPITNDIPGGPIKDENGNPLNYDIRAQTEACILNIEAILKSSGAELGDIVDVTSFLINMDRDFEGYNEVYAKFFANIQATRTTLAISALPTPIAVEMKVIANLGWKNG